MLPFASFNGSASGTVTDCAIDLERDLLVVIGLRRRIEPDELSVDVAAEQILRRRRERTGRLIFRELSPFQRGDSGPGSARCSVLPELAFISHRDFIASDVCSRRRRSS